MSRAVSTATVTKRTVADVDRDLSAAGADLAALEAARRALRDLINPPSDAGVVSVVDQLRAQRDLPALDVKAAEAGLRVEALVRERKAVRAVEIENIVADMETARRPLIVELVRALEAAATINGKLAALEQDAHERANNYPLTRATFPPFNPNNEDLTMLREWVNGLKREHLLIA